MRVLIGYDGSNVAETVIEDLKWAGLSDRVLATVMSAADVFMPPAPDASTLSVVKPAIEKSRTMAQEALRLAQSLSEHGTQQVKKAFPEWKVFSESCADSPAWALIKKAEEWKADLIVVGAHGHSQIGRFIGSVSQMVLVHASHSVRIARPRLNPKAEKVRILIGVDGSKGAQAAIDAVANRSWGPKTDIFLMSVIEPKMKDERSTIGRSLESRAKKLREKGAIVTCRVETGDPKKILLDHAETWKADSIFLGARGLGNLKRFLIGGVSAAVSARANCSVEVVR